MNTENAEAADAFRLTGNAIAVGHSMLCIAQTVCLLDGAWPFGFVPSLSQLYDIAVGHAMKLSSFRVERDHECQWLVPVTGGDEVPSPSPKRLRTEQTLEISLYEVDDAQKIVGLEVNGGFLCPYSIWTNLKFPFLIVKEA